ncbi:hypothetical protein NXF25_016994 [Crotalus adamanteus]|uniref:Uncharacterized protein n=1 Tax=Crotalus adamanteus TaxID=8729 RepID=A0AAW1ATN9_CROAD
MCHLPGGTSARRHDSPAAVPLHLSQELYRFLV